MSIFQYLLVAVLIALIDAPAAGRAADPVLAPITASNLNGDDVSIPRADRTILLVGFEREQQGDIDSWINGLDLAQSGLTWYELPVIDDPGAILRWVITNGMRNGISNPDRRAHVVTLFTDRESLLKSLGISDVTSCYAMVIDSTGKLLISVFGHYDQEAAKNILFQARQNFEK